jgi:hypothetical protein
LNADHGIQLGVEVSRTSEDFCRNLKLFDWDSWVVNGVFRQIAEQFAQGLRAMQGMAGHEPVNLPEK